MANLSRRLALVRSLSVLGGALPLAAWAQGKNTAKTPIKLALIESLSGPFANTGEAVYRNIVWAIERVNARGGVSTHGLAPASRANLSCAPAGWWRIFLPCSSQQALPG